MQIRWPNEIIYQIFPDRFFSGDPSHRVKDGEYLLHGKPVAFSQDSKLLTASGHHQRTFYGGDLAGIIQKLPYLKELGITALYLNPIFASKSTHKYDTDDYFQIDPHLGTKADYDALVLALKQVGIKLILDGVFNHTSYDHPWYQNSKATHYLLKGNGEVRTWMNSGSLPKLNLTHPEVAETLASVLSYWKGVDAWRLDAAHLLDSAFLKRLRQSFDGLLIGEEWEHAGGAIAENLYDGTTNFLYRRPLEAFFQGDLAAESLARRLSLVPETYPWAGVVQSWSILNNHDTNRFFTAIGHRVALMEFAASIVFTLPGTPLIYFGDEIGMRGRDHRQARAPMEWDESRWNQRILRTYKRLIALRKQYPALATGSLKWLWAENCSQTFAYVRQDAQNQLLILANGDDVDHRIDVLGISWSVPSRKVLIEVIA